ncbi:hypothetical protein Ptr902_11993 [Pyrenophora tritici-repentis]|nr:hypothetical protein Ptr902_11993 [Pyrenophora tritici-repentis]
MFGAQFKGSYKEYDEAPRDAKDSLDKSDDLSVVDTESETTGHDTPPTTRATSPAPTERTAESNSKSKDHQRKQEPPKLPTLKYVAIIETETDKAICELKPECVDEEVCKLVNSAKEMCDKMFKKGYEGKVKLQDIMDIGLDMAMAKAKK